ncbi:ABC transporter ATP-binding protein [Leucobacter weissii]|uniref:ABC transporter ATP-binding protein n=1 Tax=Leucobacter weissii TaxID=1983706 RepID=A0A939MK04_9MICO|nr:ABC transporter ATP-binding protein [Leucobacter weissii]MBO1902384.1 ABC transporter ATP-binding protein [Leucobacter weissii]
MDSAGAAQRDATGATLTVTGLTVRYPGAEAPVLHDLSFSLARGARLAVVGGSGTGKSTLALALLGLLPDGAEVSGTVELEGTVLSDLSRSQLARRRGAELSLVYQNPQAALDPRRRLGRQLVSLLRVHRRESGRQLREECARLLGTVGFQDPGTALGKYPHELSGGMLQRAMIAVAVASRPRVLLADEPTTALDVTNQEAVLRVLEHETAVSGSALMLITHNLALVRNFCDEVIVLDRGRIVDSGATRAVLDAPSSPVTERLIEAIPVLPGSPSDSEGEGAR